MPPEQAAKLMLDAALCLTLQGSALSNSDRFYHTIGMSQINIFVVVMLESGGIDHLGVVTFPRL